MRQIYLLALIFFLTGCCKQQLGSSEVLMGQKFVLPAIPSTLKTVDQRAEYLSLHYWDTFNMKDTTYVGRSYILEPIFADYLSVISVLPTSKAFCSVNKFMSKAELNGCLYTHFINLSEKYLYDSGAPMLNENLYLLFLKVALSSNVMSREVKEHVAYQYKLVSKNSKGNRAQNIRYTLVNGSQNSLYDIKSKYVLLFINNPDCTDCRVMTQRLISSKIFSDRVACGDLRILSFYPDEDLSIWQKHQDEMPKSWINAYDKQMVVRNNNLYDLKKYPTLYLLDQNKRVLLKDTCFDEVELFLQQE